MRKNLQMLRIAHDLTQEEMAARLGITRVAYWNIENGKSKGSIDFWLTVQREFPDSDITELTEVRTKA